MKGELEAAKEGISVIQAAIDLVSNIVTIAGCVDVAAKIDINEYEQTELHRDYESLNEYLSRCYPQHDEEVEKIIREIHLEVEEANKKFSRNSVAAFVFDAFHTSANEDGKF